MAVATYQELVRDINRFHISMDSKSSTAKEILQLEQKIAGFEHAAQSKAAVLVGRFFEEQTVVDAREDLPVRKISIVRDSREGKVTYSVKDSFDRSVTHYDDIVSAVTSADGLLEADGRIIFDFLAAAYPVEDEKSQELAAGAAAAGLGQLAAS